MTRLTHQSALEESIVGTVYSGTASIAPEAQHVHKSIVTTLNEGNGIITIHTIAVAHKTLITIARAVSITVAGVTNLPDGSWLQYCGKHRRINKAVVVLE
jgi:hypothetical protein